MPDDAVLELEGASSVWSTVIGGTTYLFVAGFLDDGVSVFSVGADGVLANVSGGNVTDVGDFALAGATAAASVEIGGISYLFVAGFHDDGVIVFAAAPDGSLVNVANVTDDVNLELRGAASVATATFGATSYLFVGGPPDPDHPGPVREERTDCEGVYRFLDLEPGEYHLVAEAEGFLPQSADVFLPPDEQMVEQHFLLHPVE